MIIKIPLRDVSRIEHVNSGQACIGDAEDFHFSGNHGMVIHLVNGKGVVFIPNDVIIHIDREYMVVE